MRLIRTALISILLGTCSLPVLTFAAQAQVEFSVEIPPPPLPVYEQPPIPTPGWIWTPGFWSYDEAFGYYWVPGTWLEAPRRGLLWTPGYWAYDHAAYRYNEGYWSDHVGYYGGVNYGYGYTGSGYEGGYWQGDRFFYNQAVNNLIAANIVDVYSRPVSVNQNGPRVSYNGGQGGLTERPTAEQQTYAREQHEQPTELQRQHAQMASQNPALRESENKGRPPVAATARPNDFKGEGVKAAQSAGERPAGQEIPHGRAAPGMPNGGPEPSHALPTPGNAPAGQPHPGGAEGERPAPGARPTPAQHQETAPGQHPGMGGANGPGEHPPAQHLGNGGVTERPISPNGPNENAHEAPHGPGAGQPTHGPAAAPAAGDARGPAAKPATGPVAAEPQQHAPAHINAEPAHAAPEHVPSPAQPPRAVPQVQPQAHPQAEPHPGAVPHATAPAGPAGEGRP